MAALEARVAALEQREERARAAVPAPIREQVRAEISSFEAERQPPWMSADSWNALKPGMSEQEVITLLGPPTRKLDSLRAQVDSVFFYRSQARGAGRPLEGKVNFVRGRVRDFEAPRFIR